MFHELSSAQRRFFADSGPIVSELMKVAEDFRAWVVRDLISLTSDERQGFRGDYLFLIDGKPSFLVVVTPDSVSSGRLESWRGAGNLQLDLGHPIELTEAELCNLMSNNGAVRVCVETDSNTLRRLLLGSLKARVAYLNGLVKISGDLPCFMRLVGLLKGKGVGPVVVNAQLDA
jgi:hypothetical protein